VRDGVIVVNRVRRSESLYHCRLTPSVFLTHPAVDAVTGRTILADLLLDTSRALPHEK
jgi:hypothetical protein